MPEENAQKLQREEGEEEDADSKNEG